MVIDKTLGTTIMRFVDAVISLLSTHIAKVCSSFADKLSFIDIQKQIKALYPMFQSTLCRKNKHKTKATLKAQLKFYVIGDLLEAKS